MKVWLLRLRGWWRMLWGNCPWCGSDPVKRLGCPVCGGWQWDDDGEFGSPGGVPPWQWDRQFEHWLKSL